MLVFASASTVYFITFSYKSRLSLQLSNYIGIDGHSPLQK